MIAETFIDLFATAIATAEGFFVPNSRAARNNNPGNMTRDLIGRATGRDGMFVVYATAADGWTNLKKQIQITLNGSSGIYNIHMTIQDFANKYTTTQQLEWARNVASKMGVSVDTTIAQILSAEVAIPVGVFVVFLALYLYVTKKK